MTDNNDETLREFPDHIDPIERAILDLVRERGADKSVDPAEAAKLAYPEDWNGRMKAVKAMAVGLARKGDIVILRKGSRLIRITLRAFIG